MHFKMKRPKDSHKVGVTIMLAIVEPLCFYELIKEMIRRSYNFVLELYLILPGIPDIPRQDT